MFLKRQESIYSLSDLKQCRFGAKGSISPYPYIDKKGHYNWGVKALFSSAGQVFVLITPVSIVIHKAIPYYDQYPKYR